MYKHSHCRRGACGPGLTETGLVTMRQAGNPQVVAGITAPEEVLAVTG